ncbi:IclR family transcriptional regulator C-terminal domain-containing protein [Natronorubrum texcoconense]|uniref:IclR family transcriptional regulator C-terminal domain-containing protein n=1 Tax=Natronorubrum texcoconense TaxID=1095776 RepID=UPI001FE0AC18|nr:IclR family transcriptional regulator C-terminal domain-containing protein [Natronorubrum texcoconense]
MILAHLPDEEIAAALDCHGLPAQTENTITDEDELFADLEAVDDIELRLVYG